MKESTDPPPYRARLQPNASQNLFKFRVTDLIQEPRGRIAEKLHQESRGPETHVITCRWRRVIDDCQERYILSLRGELLGHLEGHTPPERVPAEEVRSLRLNTTDFFDVPSSHALDLRNCLLDSTRSIRTDSVKGLIRSHLSGQIHETKDLAPNRVDTEEGMPGAMGLKLHDRGPSCHSIVPVDDFGQRFNGWCLHENCEGKSQSEHFLDLNDQVRSREGIAPQPEEVVVNANPFHAENLSPDLRQFRFDIGNQMHLSMHAWRHDVAGSS